MRSRTSGSALSQTTQRCSSGGRSARGVGPRPAWCSAVRRALIWSISRTMRHATSPIASAFRSSPSVDSNGRLVVMSSVPSEKQGDDSQRRCCARGWRRHAPFIAQWPTKSPTSSWPGGMMSVRLSESGPCMPETASVAGGDSSSATGSPAAACRRGLAGRRGSHGQSVGRSTPEQQR